MATKAHDVLSICYGQDHPTTRACRAALRLRSPRGRGPGRRGWRRAPPSYAYMPSDQSGKLATAYPPRAATSYQSNDKSTERQNVRKN